ncbi:unnamed protein product [Pedinophyceae sp. YPF-701]|nr:unnamed protein product [Pedinophyceae sp. YPF-701]
MGMPSAGTALLRGPSGHTSGRDCSCAAKKKGFGKAAPPPPKPAAKKTKGPTARPTRRQPAPGQGPQQMRVAAPPDSPPDDGVDLLEDAEFQARLARTREQGAQRQRQMRAAAGPLGPANGGAINYDAPPPITATLASNITNPEDAPPGARNAAGVAVAAILAGILFLTSGVLDGLGGGGGAPTAVDQPGLTKEQRKVLTEQAKEFEAKLAEDASDADALEALAVTYAELGRFADAETKLVRLTAAKPGDADVLRLLGETRAQQGAYKTAAEAFLKSIEVSGAGATVEQLAEYTGALAAAGENKRAVSYLSKYDVPSETPPGGVSVSDVRLLLARAYSQWRGHANEALSIYDAMLAERPHDWRVYAAKGQLLKNEGREADAQRMFIQARYYAPKGEAVEAK